MDAKSFKSLFLFIVIISSLSMLFYPVEAGEYGGVPVYFLAPGIPIPIPLPLPIDEGGIGLFIPPILKEGINVLTSKLIRGIIEERNLKNKPFSDIPLVISAPFILMNEYPAPASPIVQSTLAGPIKALLKPSKVEQEVRVVDLEATKKIYDISAERVLSQYTSARTVIVTRGDIGVDSMASVAYAKEKNAPILLTRPRDLPESTFDAINKLKPNKVIVVGGDEAVSNEVEEEIKRLTKVERIWAETRYETALELAEKIEDPEVIVIADGTKPGIEATIVSAEYGAPLVYVTGPEIPQNVREFIIQHRETKGGKPTKIVVVGLDKKAITEIQGLLILPDFLAKKNAITKLFRLGLEILR